MSNCMLCYPNNADAAVISGGNWANSSPASNLQTRFLRQYARTVDTSPLSSTFTVNFGKLTYNAAGALVNHNLSLNAKVRIVSWGDKDLTVPVYDSGLLPVWPRWFDSLKLRWGDANFWGGQVSERIRTASPSIFLHIFAADGFTSMSTGAFGETWHIVDPGNGAGYIQAGRLYIAENWTPQHNMIYGASMAWVDQTIVDRSLDGTKWFEERTKYRTVAFQLKYMRPNEGVNNALIMTQQLGLSGEVLYIFDPANAQLMQQRSFIGTLSELSPLEWWMFGLTSMAYKIEESV